MQPQQTRITPPLRRTPLSQNSGHPPSSIPVMDRGPLVSMSSEPFDASTATLGWTSHPNDFRNVFLVTSPYLARSSRAFSIPLTTTVFSQCRAWWFRICPRGPILEGRIFAPPSATQLRHKERRCYYTSPLPAAT